MSNASYSFTTDAYNVAQRPKGIRFTGREVFHLLVATAVLTIAFSLSFTNGIFTLASDLGSVVAILPIAFIAVLTGYLCHELAHKAVAQRYGLWAEFRYWPFGLLLALGTSLMGFVFAAPGAVYSYGQVTFEKNGRISAAGPMVNIIIGAALAPMVFFLPAYLSYVAFIVASINLFLAGFNLLPIPPLDGSKVFAWNKAVWLAMLLIAAALYLMLVLF